MKLLLNFPEMLKKEFPGFLDDSEVNGADLTSWIGENLQGISDAAESTKNYIADLERRLIRQAAYNVDVSIDNYTNTDFPKLVESIATELASCGYEMIEHSITDARISECLKQLREIHGFDFEKNNSPSPKPKL